MRRAGWGCVFEAFAGCSLSLACAPATLAEAPSDTPPVSRSPETASEQARIERAPIRLPAFFAEGLAWSPTAKRLFLGGIVGQSVVSVDIDGGSSSPFGAPPTGWSVFGVAVDDERGLVWAACSAVPQGKVLPSDVGRAGVIAFGLEDGAVEHARLTESDDSTEHLFGDLVVAEDGVVFVTDTKGGGVFSASAGSDALSVVVTAGTFRSVQGIVSDDDSTLLAADYSTGLHRLRLGRAGSLAEMSAIDAPANLDLRGIDGIALRGRSLAAVQNAAQPPRILRLELSADVGRVESAEVVATPSVDDGEPTLATFVEHELWVMQTDRWDRVFDPEGRPKAAVEIASPTIVRLRWD